MPDPRPCTITELRHTAGVPLNLTCPHLAHVPPFDLPACRYLTAEQIRSRFPRYAGRCSACHQEIRVYASLEHYQLGDWA